jgi:DnaJ-class molecular chaperone
MPKNVFSRIHQAYETLYDEAKRKNYDAWGSKSGSSSSSKSFFDAGVWVFFDVVFGFSPELEPYIGDLSFKSFANTVVELLKATQGMDGDEQSNVLFSNLLKAVLDTKRTTRRDYRQVDIALYFQKKNRRPLF